MRLLATAFALALAVPLLGATPAWAYRLPPEKVLQYWAARVGRYGDFEVRLKHTLHSGEAGVTPDVTEARILYTVAGRFRLDRTGEGVRPYVVLGDERAVLAVRNGVALGEETMRRYEFARLFALGRRIEPQTLEALRVQGAAMDSPPVLWLLARLARMEIAWPKARLAPYPSGSVAYVLGVENRDALAAQDLGRAGVDQLWFDNREFTPLELRRWIDDGAGGKVPYRAVLGEYGNDILKYYPRRTAIYVGGALVEEFELLSARLQPEFSAADLDLERQRPALLQGEERPVPPTGQGKEGP